MPAIFETGLAGKYPGLVLKGQLGITRVKQAALAGDISRAIARREDMKRKSWTPVSDGDDWL